MTPTGMWMLRALKLAEQGRGHVEPNPLVGDGARARRQNRRRRLASEVRPGSCGDQRHGSGGGTAQGATLYVTLEPCCHHGKTPPCTDAVIAAGITRVVAAMLDPFPQVAGQGAARLRQPGIAVEVGMCEQEARRLNAPYLKLLATGKPYVHAKWAMTLDGKIATASGDSRWISNEASRKRVHEMRGKVDAIIVGIGTALADDPLLSARPPGPRVATRIVLDSQGRLPLTSQLVRTAQTIPTLVVMAESERADGPGELLSGAGCEVVRLPGAVNVPELLKLLGGRRWTNVLVEGGARVLGSFLDAQAIDQVHVFIAPRLAGGRGAASAHCRPRLLQNC